ncbi:MAG: alpha/beta hydrolase-fold protein [Prevotellaceae bacterium]|nr:alpha/beta hydrolase-fold protein [Prevotella sp.]MDD7258323.1 alpha/beta hydrolase-fold protein [Prevotellaceae bacterium]MDY6129822.1 alpha/beta hydrolase-fold protein [Prevotella sp.]
MDFRRVKMKRMVLLYGFLVGCLCAFAQTGQQGTFSANRNVIPQGYNFWLYTPDEYHEYKHPLPLIIFLHGASLCGNNLDRVRRYGVLDAIDKGKVIPTFVLAPQNPGGAWSPQKLNDLLEWVEKNYEIDKNRIYVLGMSLGGYGTLDFVGTYPEKVAAAMALCGGCSLKDMDGLGKLPLWIMHGTADRAVGVGQSKRVVDYLQQTRQDRMLRFKWIQGGSHGLLARLFYLQKTYDWLIAHSLADNPRCVDDHFDIDQADINGTYRDLKTLSGEYDKD